MAFSPLHESTAPVTQGIQGQVLRLSGNQMPSVGSASLGQAEPVQTVVWIFAGQIPATGSPYWPVSEAQDHPALVVRVSGDEAGRYAAELAAGEYTVFAESGENLYLNRFSGSGNFASVVVEPGQAVELDLQNTEAASF
ncbi:hypothetical protein [Pseudanabaena sp. FACHB-2040]|uniref:hypothetical protein n=1 Tax=Pseudanabaena sp. FACHB-2040 TaxID=2692859 RepID=UPI0016856FE7|nr:hypothetical protein [Pseudanabaena sp. FACHB-2040]MBD2256834.1 hypothetical protein [Pseudanabaena sp. FACHB-2040]